MKKITLILLILATTLVIGQAYSSDGITTLYIDQTAIKTESPILSVEGNVFLPMISTFETLGAQVYQEDNIIAYYLNSFVKVDLDANQYSVNGKNFNFNHAPFYKEQILYVPLEVVKRAFDLVDEKESDEAVYLKANTVIQYRYFDEIQYKQVSYDDQGARFSIPLDWLFLEESVYGYMSNYGQISVEFSSVDLNDNINTAVVMKTFEEHLLIDHPTNVQKIFEDQSQYDHLTSNVLYIDLLVNEKDHKKIIHFIQSGDKVYILEFTYPKAISETYMTWAINNMLSSFYINALTFDPNSEHYFETRTASRLKMSLNEEVYANMIVDNKFYLSGQYTTDQAVDSLTILVSRGQEQIEVYVPVENNHFETWIYTPFGLGRHNIQVALTGDEEKIVLDGQSLSNEQVSKAEDLLHFSVVNISNDPLRYLIPTKMVQSQHEYLTSMSQLLTYKNNTLYSKARSIYDFMVEDIEVLPSNTVNSSALDVYKNYKGTELEIAYYMTALLRAQNIPARIIKGNNDFIQHHWVEANLNGKWLVIDVTGDDLTSDRIEGIEPIILPPAFGGVHSQYHLKYPQKSILNH